MTEAQATAAEAAPKKPKATAAEAADTVRVRVIKKGDGRIHDGQGGRYAKGAEFDTSPDIAVGLEDSGLVDVL